MVGKTSNMQTHGGVLLKAWIYKNKKAGYAGSFTETLTILLIKQLQLRFQPEDLFGLQLLRKSLSDLQPEYDDQYR